MTVAPVLAYAVLQLIAALILFAAAFFAVLVSATIFLVIGRLVYLGGQWVRVKAHRWDHSLLDSGVVSLRVGALRQPLFEWWTKLASPITRFSIR